jgi:hypothetical protein
LKVLEKSERRFKVNLFAHPRQNKYSNTHYAELTNYRGALDRFCQITINEVMLALLAGPAMFENRINSFVPILGTNSFTPPIATPLRENRVAPAMPMAVQLAEIYQAAVARAVEDHELDKLFNAEFYGDAI